MRSEALDFILSELSAYLNIQSHQDFPGYFTTKCRNV